MQWRDLLASFEPTTKKYVEVYEGLGAAGEDAQLVELLLRHERARRVRPARARRRRGHVDAADPRARRRQPAHADADEVTEGTPE